MSESNSPSLLSLFGTIGVFLIVAVYGFISLNTEDFLWWKTSFEETPEQFVVNCYGDLQTIAAGETHFNELTGLVNSTLSGRKNWDSLSMSEDTYAYYQESDAVVVLEAQYRYPVRVHSIYKYFSNVKSLVMPLDGRHSGANTVFGLSPDGINAGALHTSSNAELSSYLSSSGICAIN